MLIIIGTPATFYIYFSKHSISTLDNFHGTDKRKKMPWSKNMVIIGTPATFYIYFSKHNISTLDAFHGTDKRKNMYALKRKHVTPIHYCGGSHN